MLNWINIYHNNSIWAQPQVYQCKSRLTLVISGCTYHRSSYNFLIYKYFVYMYTHIRHSSTNMINLCHAWFCNWINKSNLRRLWCTHTHTSPHIWTDFDWCLCWFTTNVIIINIIKQNYGNFVANQSEYNDEVVDVFDLIMIWRRGLSGECLIV